MGLRAPILTFRPYIAVYKCIRANGYLYRDNVAIAMTVTTAFIVPA